MWIKLKDYKHNVVVSDILANYAFDLYGHDEDLENELDRYLIVQLSPLVKLVSIKSIKDNYILLNEETIELKDLTVLYDNGWYVQTGR